MLIWRYKYLHDDFELQTKEEKNIIARYLNSDLLEFDKNNRDVYVEGIYKQPVHNIIDYERTLTVEAAIASQREVQNQDVNKKKEKKAKKNSKEVKQVPQKSDENQILFSRVEEMKNKASKPQVHDAVDDIDDDMILSSDFMTKK